MSKHPLYAFDETDASLPLLPTAARRALDLAGAKLSLEAWRHLSLTDRTALVAAGASDLVDTATALAIADRATPPARHVEPLAEPNASEPPAALVAALGEARPLAASAWSALSPLDRYALVKASESRGPGRLARAYDEIVAPSGPPLTHLDASGRARMVDVGRKEPTERRAVATATLRMQPATLARIAEGTAPKGDVLAVARVAGIQAAKKTPELVPLCHAIALTSVEVAFDIDASSSAIVVRATARAFDRTGVEMEAIVAASTAAITVYDMVKAIDRWMTITDVGLLEKSGGRSGDVRRERA